MPSPDHVLSALNDAVAEITRAAYLDVDGAFQDGLEGDDQWCEREHCDDYSCSCPDPLDSDVIEVVKSNLPKLRMGYDTPTLREVLEEMERIINNG